MSYLESFRSSPASRQLIIVGVAFAILCGAGGVLYFSVFRTPYQVLFSNLKVSDAATIVADLDKKKVPYKLSDHGSTILAPANLVDATRLDVMSEDLPLKGMVGFELFNKSDMGLTEFAQKINYQRALQGELARTIMTLDSVDTARVHLSLPDPSIFRDDKRTPKASATIVARPGKQIPAPAVAGIRRLIAAAVPDLEPADVVILDEHGSILGGEMVSEFSTAAPGGAAAPGVESLPDNSTKPSLFAATAPHANEATPLLASASTFWTTIFIAVLVPLAFLAGLLARRRRGPGALSEAQRASFVERFQALLTKGEAGVS